MMTQRGDLLHSLSRGRKSLDSVLLNTLMLATERISVSLPHTFCAESALILAGVEGGPLKEIVLMEKSFFMEKFSTSFPATA